MKQIVLIFFILLNVSLWADSTSNSQMENILVIHSYHQGLQWTDSISAGINSVFRNENVEIHYEYLDTKRNSGEEYYQLLVEFEKQKKNLSNIDFKLIICSDNNALRFVMEYGDILYPDIPVVFCGINNFTNDMIQGRTNITGVVESIDYKATLDLITSLHPDRQNVIIIIDETITGNMIKSEVETILPDFKDVLTFEYYQDFVLDDVPEKISALGENDILFLLTFNRDIEGNFISYYDGIRMIYQESKVPIYGAWDFYFRNGIVGGMLTTGESQGIAAAQLAMEIVKGVPVSELEIIDKSPNKMMFDYNELVRFNIEKDQLPDNSIIVNQPESIFGYVAEFFLAFAIISMIALAFLYFRLIKYKRHKKLLEEMNLELEKRVNEKTLKLSEKVQLIEDKNRDLQTALSQIKTLKGIFPICSHCKNIRNDQGYWKKVECYISEATDAEFSHSLCPDCLRKHYPDMADRILDEQ